MCIKCAVLSQSLDCMEVLLQGSSTNPPTSSSDDTVIISTTPTTSLPTITETPDPLVEEASSPQKSGMYVRMS